MITLSMMQVDAFTNQPLQGNPCAVVFDADDLSEAQMLAIAREMNLSETAFLCHSEQADVRARYFTPAEEIPLAGHPTIASVHALIESGRISLSGSVTRLTLELVAGVIQVEVIERPAEPRLIWMTQLKPRFLRAHNPAEVMPLFGLDEADLLPGYPLQTVSTGTPQLMVPLRDLQSLQRASLQPASYAAYRSSSDFFSPHLFCLQGVTPAGRTFARHFGVPPDTMEDPFTGSATGGMGAYLWHHGLIQEPTFIAEQGHWMGRPGQAYVELIGSQDDIQAVRVGGQAVTVMHAELIIPE